MVWGAITYHGIGKLVFIDTRMNFECFISILRCGYFSTVEMHGYDSGQVVFQQDNDPKHVSRRTKEWISAQNIRVMLWPSCSPDLNPIENVWNYINIRVRARVVQPRTIDELKAAIEEEWHLTPLSYIRELYESMPRCIDAVLKVKGGFSKY